ncbi:MAG: response regulator, partial [Chloroflexi bacterium]|nr:response regulator [Chloroflexota bacterium]
SWSRSEPMLKLHCLYNKKFKLSSVIEAPGFILWMKIGNIPDYYQSPVKQPKIWTMKRWYLRSRGMFILEEMLTIDHIVVVEDAQIDPRMNKDIVTQFGNRTIINARERMGEISLVLLDLSMPHMSGVDVFRRLRQINPNVRVVLSSGYNQVEATRRLVGKGLAGFIPKPYSTQTLIREVRRHFGPQG